MCFVRTAFQQLYVISFVACRPAVVRGAFSFDWLGAAMHPLLRRQDGWMDGWKRTPHA
jgi:hypothetical protein